MQNYHNFIGICILACYLNESHPFQDVVKASKIAFEYRQKFRKDVIVDLVCFRRWGHNEMDDPAFTQPKMYEVIRNRRSIPDRYADVVIVSCQKASAKCMKKLMI